MYERARENVMKRKARFFKHTCQLTEASFNDVVHAHFIIIIKKKAAAFLACAQ